MINPRTDLHGTTGPAVADAVDWTALTAGSAIADLSGMGRLRITGADALDLLNRLTTNALEALPPGTARGTVVTNGNGRVIDFLHLAALPDALLCLTSPGRAQTVIDWLDTYTFGEDIAVSDRTDGTIQFALVGPLAAQALAAAGAADVPAEQGQVAPTTVGGADAVIWRTLPGGAEGFIVVTETAQAEAVRGALLGGGAAPVSADAWEAFRIANGFPVYGAEFDESANPLEARLRGVISEDKGCYTGQEVIARLLTYRKVQRRLMAVDLSGPAAPGMELTEDGQRAGVLTSCAVLPDGRAVGLALVSMKMAEAGRAFQAGPDATAVLREPPYALATEPADD